MNSLLRKIAHTIKNPERVVVLDYAVSPKPLYTPETKPHSLLYDLVSKNDLFYEYMVKRNLEQINSYIKIHLKASDDKVPAWENGFFPAFDTMMLYTVIKKYQPKRYVEIGSGNSTKLAYYCRSEENLNFSITCIDPNPRREIKEIADEWFSDQIQSFSVDYFKSLQPDDIVFLDGSHVLHANSDVMWFFMEILPFIPPGVIIHVHDIFIPYDYPQWVCDRFFSEQYILAACLLNSPAYNIISPNYYILTKKIARPAIEELWKIPSLQNVKKHGRSFWFSKL